MVNLSQSGFIIRGISGALETVVPLDAGDLAHYRRSTTDESDPSKHWEMGQNLRTHPPKKIIISAVSMILSDYGEMGKLIEIVALAGKTLFFYSLNQSPRAWVGPINIASGVAGNPALIQRNNGEFHLVVPLLGSGLAHYWRKNDNPNPKEMIWEKENFGSGIISAVSMIESDYGNLELVAKEGDKLVFYQKTEHGWSEPHPMGSIVTGPIDGVTGSPALIQSAFPTWGTHKNFELVVPRAKPYQGNGLCAYWRNNDGLVNDDPTQSWIGPDIITDTEKLKSSANSVIRRNGPDGDLTIVSLDLVHRPHSAIDKPPIIQPLLDHPSGLIVTSRTGTSDNTEGTWGKPATIFVPPIVFPYI